MTNHLPPLAESALSVNRQSLPLVERLLASADALRVAVRRDAAGPTIVDAGIEVPGSIAAACWSARFAWAASAAWACAAARSTAGRAGSR